MCFQLYSSCLHNLFYQRSVLSSRNKIIMCGIICEINCSGNSILKHDEQLSQRIKHRGPNLFNSTEITVKNQLKIIFSGAVLWMQGQQPVTQPVENDVGVLLYNGDIFDKTWDSEISDTQQIMDRITNAAHSSTNIIQQIKSFKGPFSLIYYRKENHCLYFARDRIGRNSLVMHKNNHAVVISSVLGRTYECVEVPATDIYILNVITHKIRLVSWGNDLEIIDETNLEDWIKTVKHQQTLPDDEFVFDFDENLELTDEDLVIEYMERVSKETKCKLTVMQKLMDNIIIRETVYKIIDLLEKSVEIRLNRQPNKCKDCLHINGYICNHCTVGILFSGGLDCTILALMADKYLPKYQKIDLINVAFKKNSDSSYDVPDRLTGKQSLQELRQLCPSREWVFREVNVPKDDLEHFQISVIGDLVYPRQTILDESLGSVLWFAAKGEFNNSVSPCRILLLGSGADELFGGYIRHRNAFKRKGWCGLSKELLLDWNRISYRNLARDNRVICDHGRQPRMPYLDEHFTEFVLKLKPWLKCFPSEKLDTGIGDKLMLRLVAYSLGLTAVATLPKRAMQFGSRIANKKERGSDISNTFLIK